MNRRRGIMLGLAVLSVVMLVWRVDVGAVRAALGRLGWGMTLIVGQELVAHVCNALAWRMALSPSDAARVPFRELLGLRIAGDAVNYLTPTATLGGELARMALLQARGGAAEASVIVAKLAQTVAQAVFIVAGAVFFAASVSTLWMPAAGPVIAGIAVVVVLAVTLRRHGRRFVTFPGRLTAAPRAVELWRNHPGRVVMSAVLFAAAYLWGAFEAYWICWFLGLRIPVGTALVIETLSIAVDGLFFMVPAKIGTQEGGKVAIFLLLGLPASLGFAFGVARHVREFAWAAAGAVLCWVTMRSRGMIPAPAVFAPRRPPAAN
jgi:hypothetical protein